MSEVATEAAKALVSCARELWLKRGDSFVDGKQLSGDARTVDNVDAAAAVFILHRHYSNHCGAQPVTGGATQLATRTRTVSWGKCNLCIFEFVPINWTRIFESRFGQHRQAQLWQPPTHSPTRPTARVAATSSTATGLDGVHCAVCQNNRVEGGGQCKAVCTVGGEKGVDVACLDQRTQLCCSPYVHNLQHIVAVGCC